MVTTFILLILLTVYGLWEYRSHVSHLNKIPVRIHVNGTRGKSSVTRLIVAGLRAGGHRVIGKTTGTEPRIILEDGSEFPIYRVGKANILEQLTVVRFAWERRAEILVAECMAVHPSLQRFVEDRIIRSSIGVVTNARADHLDEMGPTIRDVAEALCGTIPRNGTLFTADQDWLPVFEKRAGERRSTVVFSEASEVREQDMEGFRYLEHRENVAIALKVCSHFGVPRDTALDAMKGSNPDAGALMAYHVQFQNKEILFYNAFAANDRDSTLLIYNRLHLKDSRDNPVMVVINNRGDRLQRAEQFGRMMADDLNARYYFLMGDFTKATEDIAIRGGLSPERIVNLRDATPEEAFEAILTKTERRCTVFGVGNIGGMGKDLALYFKNRGEEWLKQPSDWAS